MYGVLNHPNKGEYDVAGPLSQSIGNGNCDNWLNKVECNYDAGDCCGSNNDLGFCHNTKGTHHYSRINPPDFRFCISLRVIQLPCVQEEWPSPRTPQDMDRTLTLIFAKLETT